MPSAAPAGVEDRIDEEPACEVTMNTPDAVGDLPSPNFNRRNPTALRLRIFFLVTAALLYLLSFVFPSVRAVLRAIASQIPG